MAQIKPLIKALVIISLSVATATGIYVYRNSVLDKQLSKVHFFCPAPILKQPLWPNSMEAVVAHITELQGQDKELTQKIDVMLKEAKETAAQSKLGYYRARDLEQLNKMRAQLRDKISQAELMKSGDFSLLELFANKHNLYFKGEILKRFPKHARDINDIIKVVEATDIYTDKRILGLKFYNRTTVQVQTGMQKGKSGVGEVLTLRKKRGRWNIVNKKQW